jgi:hypothetical protein
MFGFLHCFIGWLGRETGYEPTDRLASVLWIMSGALFLRSNDSVQLCRRLAKGCHIRGLPAGSVRRAYMSCWLSFCLQGVYRFELPRLSDMSTACLWQSSRSKLTNLMSLMQLLLCCLIYLIVCNSCLIRVGCIFSFNDLSRAKTWN